MEEEILKRVKLLKRAYGSLWAVAILFVILGETELFPVGILIDNVRASFYCESVSILLMALCVPLSLKLFSLVLTKKIDTYAFPVALSRYTFWSLIRLGILGVGVVFNILVYYLTLNNTGLLCALITLTASLFCVPSERKLREELHVNKGEPI